MRQINRMRNQIITTTNSSETTNSMSIANKQTSNDTDKILNIKCESTNDISTINNNNTFSPANLFRKHKQRFNRGLNNKLCKIRIFFDNLIHRSTNSNENNSNNNKLHNNLNDSSLKHHSKYYSIALNLLHGDQSLYENTYCTCGGNIKDDKICINCFHQGKFQNKQLTAIMATPSQTYSMTNKSSFEFDTSLSLDMLNATSLIHNPNYVLYDIPELDETDDNLNEESEYYYNRTEKI